jgi:hypothetical protein
VDSKNDPAGTQATFAAPEQPTVGCVTLVATSQQESVRLRNANLKSHTPHLKTRGATLLNSYHVRYCRDKL